MKGLSVLVFFGNFVLQLDMMSDSNKMFQNRLLVLKISIAAHYCAMHSTTLGQKKHPSGMGVLLGNSDK